MYAIDVLFSQPCREYAFVFRTCLQKNVTANYTSTDFPVPQGKSQELDHTYFVESGFKTYTECWNLKNTCLLHNYVFPE